MSTLYNKRREIPASMRRWIEEDPSNQASKTKRNETAKKEEQKPSVSAPLSNQRREIPSSLRQWIEEDPSANRPSSSASKNATEKRSYVQETRSAFDKNIVGDNALSEEERSRRIADLDGQITELTTRVGQQRQALGRVGINASTLFKDNLKADEERLAALRAERTELERSAPHSASDELDWKIADTEKKLASYANSLPSSGDARGIAQNPAALEEYRKRSSEYLALQEELAALRAQRERLDYVQEYDGKSYDDNFWGQTKASYTQGRLSQDSAAAWNDYLRNPSEENRAYAEAIDEVLAQFQTDNQDTLADDAKLPWLSQSLAGYAPQLLDQTKASLQGGLTGAAIGSAIPVLGTATGLKAGIVAGSGMYSYNTMRGAAFKALLDAGVPEDVAREAANDEAVISAAIEMADTGIDIATLGLGKLGVKGAGSVLSKWAGDSAVKKFALGLGKYGINILSEATEEGLQSAVSIANQDRASRGDSGKLGLVGDSASTLWNAATGKDTESREQILADAAEGAKLAAMMFPAGVVANTATQKAGAAVGNSISGKRLNAMGEDVVQATIETGLESAPETESYKQAVKLQQKRDSGKTITNRELGRLYRENVKTVEAEQNAAQEASKATEDNLPSENENAAPAATQRAVSETAKKKSDVQFGQYGDKAFERLMESGNMSRDEAKRHFSSAYQAGRTNLPPEMANLIDDAQREAFKAGLQDYNLDSAKAFSAALKGKESMFVENDVSKRVLSSEKTYLYDEVAKKLGIKIVMAEQVYNGLANGSYKDGVVTIAADAVDPDFVVVKHEITHHMQKAAPKEYTEYRNIAVQYMSQGRPAGANTLVDDYIANAAAQGVRLDTEGAMDEIAADFTERILTDEQALRDFVTQSSQREDTRTVAQKFFDSVREFIRKVKSIFRGDKRKMDDAAVQEFGATVEQLERAERLWKETFEAAAKQASQNEKNAPQSRSEDGVQYMLNPKFGAEFDEWYNDRDANGKLKSGGYLNVGTTSDALQEIGVKDYSIYWDKGKLIKIMNDHPEMTPTVIKAVPQILEHPILAMQSTTVANRITLYGETMAADGTPVRAAMELRPQNKRGEIMDFAKVATAHGRSAAQTDINQSDILYVDPNKKRTDTWLEALRLQLPAGLTKYGPIGKVTYVTKDVKGNITFGETNEKTAVQEAFERARDGRQFSLKDSTGKELTKEQQEYFKDSKVRSRDGSLQVVFHGGMVEDSFDTARGGDGSTQYGAGAYFTDSEYYASEYSGMKGGEVRPYYLNITKMFDDSDFNGGEIADGPEWTKLVSILRGRGLNDRQINGIKEWGFDRLKNLLAQKAGGEAQSGIFGASQLANDVIREAGYEGIRGSLYDSFQYVIFEPEQAKLTSNKKPTADTGVKFSLKSNDGNTLSEEQAEYFKDSKVRDDNGNLKVMYQGGSGDFTVFDRRKSKPSNLYGRGFYFTDSESHAKQYGDARAFYLDIKNPVAMAERTITKGQMRTFLEAVAENEDDFSFENYGYGATVDSVLKSLYSGKSDFAMLYDVSQTAIGDMVAAVELFNEVNGTDYDGLILDTETVIFRSEQAKAVANQKPTSDPDIRFSLKSQRDVLAENAKLKEVNEELKAQFKTTTFAKIDKKSLDNFTKQIIKDYQSGADITDVRNDLDTLYGYLMNGEDGHAPSWDVAYRMAYDISKGILEDVSIVNDELYQSYKGLRDYLRNTGLTLDRAYEADLGGYENLNEFRRANFGRIKLVNDGLPVDTAYQELASSYPEFFNEQEYTHPADQLTHMAEVLDSLQPFEENPYSHNMREAATWLANDIMERFYELPQAKPTFADKAERRLTEQAIKDAKKLERVREQKNERIAKLIKEGTEKVKAVRSKEKAAKWEAVAKVKDHYKAKESKMSEDRKASAIRGRIMRHAKDLDTKLRRPTDKNHIPQNLQATVLKLLESINLESKYEYAFGTDGKYHRVERGTELGAEPTKRTQAFAELKKLYSEMAAELTIDPDLMGDDGLLTDVIALADKPLATMTSTELQTVWDVLRAVEASVKSANKMFSEARWATISEMAEILREGNEGKKERSEYNYGIDRLQKLTGLDMMTPETFLHLLGDGGDAIFRMMRNAQDDHIRIMKEVADFTHSALKDADVPKLESQMHTVTLGREPLKLSTAQLMELYVLTRREQAFDHIFVGGILPDVVSAKGLKKLAKAKPVRGITLEEVAKAISLLTDEQKVIADQLQKFASTKLSDYGNQASMKVYNYEKFGEKNYWPIRTNRQEVQSDVQKDTATVTLANRGFTKGTKPHANNSVRLGSIFDTFATHASEMATYSAWLGTLEDVNRIRNYRFKDAEGGTVDTVKAIIDTAHGRHGTDYLAKLLNDLTNGVKGTHGETNFMSGIVSNYKAAAVGANLRVIIQQPTALLRAADMIDAKYLAVMGNPLNGWKKALKYAPIAQWKDWGYFDINTGRQMKDVLFDSDSFVDKTKNAMMWGAGAADSVAWGHLWNAVEAETKAERKDLKAGSEEFYKAVAERFTEIVDHTQVVDGIMQRSQIMRSADGITKMATSFMGEPTKQYNMLMQAAYDARHVRGDRRKAAVRRLARTALALAVSGTVNAMAQSIIDAVRDDEKEEKYWDKWLTAFKKNLPGVFNPAAYIPYVKDVVSLFQGYDVSRMDMESIEKVIGAGQNMMKALNGEGKHTIAGASINLLAELSRLAGIPVANLKREVTTFAMLAATESDNYLMQYRMEKFWKSGSGDKSTFEDILYNAYVNDENAYEIIYKDLLKEDKLKSDSKTTAEVIATAMESRMMKAQGVTKVKDLEQRYLSPDMQTAYDKKLKGVKSSSLWEAANAEQRDGLKDSIYDLVMGNSDGEDLKEKIDEGAAYGIDETEYLLYKMALEMHDTPNASGKLGGSPTNKEAAKAIAAVPGLTDFEQAYLWNEHSGSDEVFEAYDAGVDIADYLNFKAGLADLEYEKDTKNAKQNAIIDLLNSMGLTDDEWDWLYGTEYKK